MQLVIGMIEAKEKQPQLVFWILVGAKGYLPSGWKEK